MSEKYSFSSHLNSPPSSHSEPGKRKFWQRFFNFWKRRNGSEELREVIEDLIEEHDADPDSSAFGADEGSLLKNILKLRDLTAYDVMIPRADIVAVPIHQTLQELLKVFSREGHSRLPLYRDNLDEVIGFVHIRDVLACTIHEREYQLEALKRDMLFVAPTMSVLDLLLEMRLNRIHMAVVIDEFGGTDGLITIEDVIEEIVGDIEDEHDVPETPGLINRSDGSWLADARLSIEELEQQVGKVLTAEEEKKNIDTIGGLIFSLTGRIPSRGELITHPSGLNFEIIEADPRRIKKLRITRSTPAY